MTGKILFCDKNDFNDREGKLHEGYSLGVFWRESNGKNRVKEFWKKEYFAPGEVVSVIYSKKYQNYLVFHEQPLTMPCDDLTPFEDDENRE